MKAITKCGYYKFQWPMCDLVIWGEEWICICRATACQNQTKLIF